MLLLKLLARLTPGLHVHRALVPTEAAWPLRVLTMLLLQIW